MELGARLAADLLEFGEPRDQAERAGDVLAKYSGILAQWSDRINLTGLRDPVEIAERLLVPPLVWARLIPTTPHTIADIGSGAGLPGIPLSQAFPKAQIWLVEARERRHHFQRHVLRTLELDRVEALRGRAEELPTKLCDLAVAQALAPLSEAVFHVKRWTRVGGLIAIPQSSRCGSIDDSNLRWIGCPEYLEPYSHRRRFLWMSTRIS